ncbi:MULTISPECIES: TniQ family protein [unclassified Sulfitobacter]|uniref:TniQ family protein n=1 Tax=unclassified Sulfitobacter TaxID=196795 RepID=UPI0037469FB8
MTAHGRLPVVYLPEADERLSSWAARMAPFYAMTVSEFVAALGLKGHDVFDLEWRLSEGQGALIAARTGLSPEAVQAMTFRKLGSAVRMMIARKNRSPCRHCPEDVHRKAAALPWRFRCPVHGVEFRDATGETLSNRFGTDCFKKLEGHAEAGATYLDAWARGAGQQDLEALEVLQVLTVRHRRASPPNVCEQPRMSLKDRRDYHDFLTTPIIRQALTVVVPEYDQVAPVLAKAVRPGFHALAQSSLLQCFALTVGVGRIIEDPVKRVISVMLVSDAEGQGRVRQAIRSWPLSLRRSISARLWRAQRDDRERQSAAKPNKRRLSHEFRLIQSHEYRSRIS